MARCGAARRGGVARASRFHVQSPDKDAARISVHACVERDGGRWRGRSRWSWREMAGDGGRWREVAMEIAACRAMVAAAGRGGAQLPRQGFVLAGAAQGVAAWWVKLLQSR